MKLQLKKPKNKLKQIIFLLLIITTSLCFSQNAAKKKTKVEKKKVEKITSTKIPLSPAKDKVVNPTTPSLDASVNEIQTVEKIDAGINTVPLANDCVYAKTAKTDILTDKITKRSLIVFNDDLLSIDRIYFSLQRDGVLNLLNVEAIFKNEVKFLDTKKCFDKFSQVNFVLNDGMYLLLKYVDQIKCLEIDQSITGSSHKIASLKGSFILTSEIISSLKNKPLAKMEIKFAKSIENYEIQKNIFLESDNTMFEPANYFIKYLKCIDN